jgi:hypothetical protein
MQHAIHTIPPQDGFRMDFDSRPPRNIPRPTIIKRAANSTLGDYLSVKGLDNIALRAGTRTGLQPFGYFANVYDRVNRTHLPMMFNTVQSIANLQTPDPQNAIFCLQQNYKYMGPVPGVSDHLPIFLSF